MTDHHLPFSSSARRYRSLLLVHHYIAQPRIRFPVCCTCLRVPPHHLSEKLRLPGTSRLKKKLVECSRQTLWTPIPALRHIPFYFFLAGPKPCEDNEPGQQGGDTLNPRGPINPKPSHHRLSQALLQKGPARVVHPSRVGAAIEPKPLMIHFQPWSLTSESLNIWV